MLKRCPMNSRVARSARRAQRKSLPSGVRQKAPALGNAVIQPGWGLSDPLIFRALY